LSGSGATRRRLGSIGTGSMPVEPGHGIGDTPIPVEFDGGIGDGAAPLTTNPASSDDDPDGAVPAHIPADIPADVSAIELPMPAEEFTAAVEPLGYTVRAAMATS
jgi:hypothetical protein